MDLNPQQKESSEAGHGPLLIVAGAGTGKTRTLIARLIYLIESGVPPEKICAITFTNKAAGEMANRIAHSANRDTAGDTHLAISASPFIGTFHSLGAKILRKEARLLGRTPSFVIFDHHDSFDLIKKVTKKISPTDKKDKKTAREKPAFFAKKIDAIKNLTDAAKALRVSRKTEELLAMTVFERYEGALKENNAFDFDDLIEKPVRLFERNPEILKKYSGKFEAILVDEYQDLNPMQYELIKLLAGNHKNLSVVGDDEQMIYGWRHADLKIFLDFERDWPGARVKFLEENYRSTTNIIGAASAVAANNQYRRPKTLWTKNVSGEPIKIVETGDENEEAEWIAGEIESGIWNLESGTGKGKKMKNVDRGELPNSKFQIPNSIAVLYRTNAQSRAIEQALIRHKIPYRVFGGLRFYERREIKDIVAALRYALNPKDEISHDRLEKLLGKRRFAEIEQKLLSAGKKKEAPAKIVETFISSSDYFGYLENNFLDYEERRENVGELLRLASRSENLSQMLEEIALFQPTDAANRVAHSANRENDKRLALGDSQFAVNLMTIHLAKGLEFDEVFIAGCSEGIMPHAMSMDNAYRLEEERRLMYVAMTRARKKLNISFCDIPSRFIGEIPEQFMEVVDAINSGRDDEGNYDGDDNDEKIISYDEKIFF